MYIYTSSIFSTSISLDYWLSPGQIITVNLLYFHLFRNLFSHSCSRPISLHSSLDKHLFITSTSIGTLALKINPNLISQESSSIQHMFQFFYFIFFISQILHYFLNSLSCSAFQHFYQFESLVLFRPHKVVLLFTFSSHYLSLF